MNAPILRRSVFSLFASLAVLLLATILVTAAYPARAEDGSIMTVNGTIHVDGSQYPADLSTINGAIIVDSGQKAARVSAVNGSIHVGADANVGDVTTVNGAVALGTGVTAASLHTVNGSIGAGAGTHIKGELRTVNGGINLAQGVDVAGDLSNFNGRMRLVGVHVGGSVKTTNGDIYVGSGSRIDGGLRVAQARFNHGPDNWFVRLIFGDYIGTTERVPTVIIAPGAVVSGTLHFERDVKLYVSNRAKIGPVEGATPAAYAGE
jgi:DUF4097 and DUF4098 domain-containing protein YvlB